MWNAKPISHERLISEPIGWLTTVSAAGVPSTAPVWFYLEDDDTITIFSRDPSVRVRNIRENPRVTLHLDGDGVGGAIVVVNAEASAGEPAGEVVDHRGLLAKYQRFLDQYGWTAEWFADNYPTTVTLAIRSVRGG